MSKDWSNSRKFFKITRTKDSGQDIFKSTNGNNFLFKDKSTHYIPVLVANELKSKFIITHDPDDFSKTETQDLYVVQEISPDAAKLIVPEKEWKRYLADHRGEKAEEEEIKPSSKKPSSKNAIAKTLAELNE